MYITDLAFSFLGNIFSRGTTVRHAVYTPGTSSAKQEDIDVNNISAVYMCARILSSSISSMPVEVVKDGLPYENHPLYKKLKYKLSDKYNNQEIFSTLEYQLNVYGNALFHFNRGEIIPPETITDWDFKGKGGTLRYEVDWSKRENSDKFASRKTEWISSKDVWHFKGLSPDGVFGLPPVMAAFADMSVMNGANTTLSKFYQNRAMSPLALESTVQTAASAKMLREEKAEFDSKYQGAMNAGKTIQLPPNTKLTPLSLKFHEAELIATLKLTRDNVCSMYGLPSFMYSSTENPQLDVEQQSLSFRLFTLYPKMKIYTEEIKNKSLSEKDFKDKVDVVFDSKSMIDVDMSSKANAYAKLIQTGIVSPNEATKEFGFTPSTSEYANSHYLQAQLIPIEATGSNPLIQGGGDNKVDGVGSKDKDNKTKNKTDEGNSD